jgi:outer membrane receptor protein involved in Fe transport
MDRAIRFNGALFFQQWENLQFGLSPLGFQGVTFTFNAGEAEIKGAEFDFSANLGAWVVSAGGAVIEAELTTDFCNFDSDGNPTCTPAGTQLPVQPKFKGTATARYNFTLGDWESFLQGTVLHQSGTRPYLLDQDVASVGVSETDPFTTLDLSAGANINNAALEFFVHNVTDERGVLTLNTSCATSFCGGFARIYPIQPRIFGVRLSQRF